MGNIQGSVQIANAHHDPIWAMVRSERFTRYSRNRSANTEIGAEVPGTTTSTGLVGGGSGTTSCEATYALRIEEGYLAIPPWGVTTFTPATNFTRTVYVSVFRKDTQGNQVPIATDAPHKENCALIVTMGGGLVDARRKADPWVDLNGVNHFVKMFRKSFRRDRNIVLLSSIDDQVTKLAGDVAALQKLINGQKGESERVEGMLQDVRRLEEIVRSLINRSAVPAVKNSELVIDSHSGAP